MLETAAEEDTGNVPYTVYELATGRVLRGGFCPPEAVELQAALPGEAVEPVEADEVDHYFVNGERLTRQPLPVTVSKTEIASDDEDEAVISGLPVPCEVYIDGVVEEVPDGELVITSAMAATYVVEIDHWPYLPYRMEITANA